MNISKTGITEDDETYISTAVQNYIAKDQSLFPQILTVSIYLKI